MKDFLDECLEKLKTMSDEEFQEREKHINVVHCNNVNEEDFKIILPKE